MRTSLSTIAAAALFVGSAGPAIAFATSIPSGPVSASNSISGAASISNIRSTNIGSSNSRRRYETSTSTQLNAVNPLQIFRGGAAAASTTGAEAVAETFFDSTIGQALSSTFATSTPSGLFNAALAALALTTVGIKTAAKLGDSNEGDESANTKEEKPKEIKSLQMKFLSVFWLLRLSDWLQGPYFYEGECVVVSVVVVSVVSLSLDFIIKHMKCRTNNRSMCLYCQSLAHYSHIYINSFLSYSLCVQNIQWGTRNSVHDLTTIPHGICLHRSVWSSRRSSV